MRRVGREGEERGDFDRYLFKGTVRNEHEEQLTKFDFFLKVYWIRFTDCTFNS